MKQNKKNSKPQGYRPKKSVNNQNIKNKVAPVHSTNRTKLIIAGIAVVSLTIIIVLIINLMPFGSSKKKAVSSVPSAENTLGTNPTPNQTDDLSNIAAENPQNNSILNPDPNSNNNASKPTLNPPHGEPWHRCDIAVGAPLNSPPANNTPSPVNTPPDIDKMKVVDNPPMPEKTNDVVEVQTAVTEISFDKSEHNYGIMKKGSDGSCKFVFTNTGNEPLVLTGAKASCGCTVPSWPKEPILPGKTGTIDVMYDTKTMGTFNKTITVTSNAKNSSVVLNVKGEVTE